jgi:hypothetical protein
LAGVSVSWYTLAGLPVGPGLLAAMSWAGLPRVASPELLVYGQVVLIVSCWFTIGSRTPLRGLHR